MESERSCVACRTRAPKRTLVRFALIDGRLVYDLTQTAQCRGAYIHPALACLKTMQGPERWARAFRGQKPDPDSVRVALSAVVGKVLEHAIALPAARNSVKA